MDLQMGGKKGRLGLKIWSINQESFTKLAQFCRKRLIDYVELYIVPGSFDEKKLSALRGIPIIFHGPTYNQNFSITNKDRVFSESIDSIRKFASFFDEKRIIFHPGYVMDKKRDNIQGLIENLGELMQEFEIILENAPALGYKDNIRLVISRPEDYDEVIKKTGCRFCLDFGHAVAASNTHRIDMMEFVRQFQKLAPYMYHLSDSRKEKEVDEHLHLGEGDLPLKELVGLIPEGAYLSLETPKTDFLNLSEDLENLKKLRRLLSD